jgi:hypothetical protein
MTRIACAATAALLLLAPAAGAAQSGVRIELTPRVGYYAPQDRVGAVAPAGRIWYVELERIEPTASLEASARISWAGSPLSARVHGLVALPSDVSGRFTCYPGLACPEVLMLTTAEATIWAAVADMVFSPLESSPMRPFLALGAGVKRYSFSWPDAAVLVEAGTYSENGVALHAGVGLEVSLAGAPLRLEVSDYWSPEGRGLRGPDPDQVAEPRRSAQHDLAVSLGWSVIRF